MVDELVVVPKVAWAVCWQMTPRSRWWWWWWRGFMTLVRRPTAVCKHQGVFWLKRKPFSIVDPKLRLSPVIEFGGSRDGREEHGHAVVVER